MSQDSEGPRPPKKLSLSGSRLTLGNRLRAASDGAGRRTVQVEVRRKRAPAAPHRSVGPTPLNSEQPPDGLSNEERVQRIRALQEGMKKPVEIPVDTPPPKKKDPVPWTVDSHTKHPETRMWHDCVGWDNPRSENRFRMGEGIGYKEVGANQQIPAEDCKTVEEVLGLIPNLRRIGHSSRLKADLNRLFERAREDTWSKHVFNESFVSKRPDVRGEKWTRHMRPLGAKVLVRFLVHVGPKFYIDGDIDLRELRKYASSADIIGWQIVEEPPASNDNKKDNKIVPQPESKETERTVTTKQRTYQQKLRAHMLSLGPTCPFTGIELPRMLFVSHIKPSAQCGLYELDGKTLQEKEDGANVLMLTPNANWLFDQGYISFTDDGKLMRSTEGINGGIFKRLGIQDGVNIGHLLTGPVGERRQGYMEHHRRFIFRGPNKEEWRG